MSSIKIQRISDFSEFRALKPQWERLTASMEAAIPFITHDWLCCWWDAFGKKEQPAIFTAWKGDQLVGALPMVESQQKFGRVFNLKGLQSMTNTESPGFNIVCPAQDRVEFLSALKAYLTENSSTWDFLFLLRTQADACTFEALAKTFSEGGTRYITNPYSGSYLLKLDGEFPAYFSSLNKSFNKNRRHGNNKLDRLGKVLTITTEADPNRIKEFYIVENSGWKKSTSIISHGMEQFYSTLAETFARRGEFFLATISVGEKPVCSLFGLIANETFYFLKIGVDYEAPDEIAKTSPGQSLLFYVIQYCFEKKLKYFDFCGPFYEYERMWTDNVDQKQNILILNNQKLQPKMYFLGRSLFGRKKAAAPAQ